MKRLVAALLALTLLAAACGGSDETTEAPTDSESASASEMAEDDGASASEMAESESASASEPADTTTTTEAPTERTVEHRGGTTVIPAQPERIVVLNAGTMLPILIELGVETIVGAPIPDGPITATRLLDDADLVDVDPVG
ncbi:MAG: hypothetical protein AAGE98_12300, partial [Actinomycetota bacterium]